MTRRVEIVFFDAGSGHRSAARALESALLRERPEWAVRCVNLPDLIAGNRSFHWIVNRGIRWLNDEMKKEKVFDLRGKVNLSLFFHWLLTSRGLREIAGFWRDEAPDAVVSVTPMYNPALLNAARLVNPQVKYVTVPVDFEEFKRAYWFTPPKGQIYLNATERLFEQARRKGIPAEHNHRIAGMPADPALYEEPTLDIAAERARLGLAPDRPTVVMHFGGQGSTILVDMAKALAQAGATHNVIFLCGRSAQVAETIRALDTPYRKAVLDYVAETPIHFQRLADVVVGKPGALTITEGLIARRPLVLLESTGMKPVQRGNEEWVRQAGVGVIAPHAGDVPRAIDQVLADTSFREAAHRHRHRGVFEAAQLIATLVETGHLSPRRALSSAA